MSTEPNLRSVNFAAVDLRNADLSGACAVGANFSGAGLSGARLYKTILAPADLTERTRALRAGSCASGGGTATAPG